MNRRDFIQFFGTKSLGLYLASKALSSGPLLAMSNKSKSLYPHLAPSTEDKLQLAEGLEQSLLIKWGDIINSKNDTFGFNNDYLAFFPLEKNRAILWVNHEYVHPLFVSKHQRGQEKTKLQVDLEMYNVGGTLIEIARHESTGLWGLVPRSEFNRRLTASTPIPLLAARPIAGSKTAMGTLANCAGGVTPWGTVLSCEENYDAFYGEVNFETGKHVPSVYGWEKFYNNHPHHYGWVVEINPKTGAAVKHTTLGRFAHESATVVTMPDQRVAVYTGDDANDEHLYKFIASKPNSLEQGELYVADLSNKKWLHLSHEKSEILKKTFKDQTDVMIHCREAAKLLGATPLDRPEDIKVHPESGHIFVVQTNNKPKKNFHGNILKLMEHNSRHDSLIFDWEIAYVGGEETGFSCPDNLAFDKKANLWITSDISGSSIEKEPYKGFGNNALYYSPLSGKEAGKVFRFAIAPVDAEFTGPCFDHDSQTLFLSVQHPGELTTDINNPTSSWPFEKGNKPAPGIVQLRGPLLKKLMS